MLNVTRMITMQFIPNLWVGHEGDPHYWAGDGGHIIWICRVRLTRRALLSWWDGSGHGLWADIIHHSELCGSNKSFLGLWIVMVGWSGESAGGVGTIHCDPVLGWTSCGVCALRLSLCRWSFNKNRCKQLWFGYNVLSTKAVTPPLTS